MAYLADVRLFSGEVTEGWIVLQAQKGKKTLFPV